MEKNFWTSSFTNLLSSLSITGQKYEYSRRELEDIANANEGHSHGAFFAPTFIDNLLRGGGGLFPLMELFIGQSGFTSTQDDSDDNSDEEIAPRSEPTFLNIEEEEEVHLSKTIAYRCDMIVIGWHH